MLTANIKEKLERMVEQFIVAGQEKFNITDEDRLEKVMRGSVLKRNNEALEYSIAHMRKVLA